MACALVGPSSLHVKRPVSFCLRETSLRPPNVQIFCEREENGCKTVYYKLSVMRLACSSVMGLCRTYLYSHAPLRDDFVASVQTFVE